MSTRKRLVGAAVLVLCWLSLSGAQDSPRFRGPNGDGTYPDVRIRTDWRGRPPKIVWRANLGYGFSEIVVDGDRAVTAGYPPGEKKSLLCCLDAATGTEYWRIEYEDTCGGHRSSLLGPIATPLIDGGRVYMVAAMGALYCYNLADGRAQWAKVTNKDSALGEPHGDYGDGVSPVSVGDLLIAQLSVAKDAAAWHAFNKNDGSLVWSHPIKRRERRSRREIIDRAYCAPAVCELNGERHLILVSNAAIDLVNLKTGACLYSHSLAARRMDWGPFVEPVMVGTDKFFLGLWYAKGKGGCANLFELRPDGLTRLWANNTVGKGAYTYVVHDAYVYGYGSPGLQCVALDTGDARWKWRSTEPRRMRDQGEIVLLGDKLVWISTSGILHVGEASPDRSRPLAEFALIGKPGPEVHREKARYNNVVCTAPNYAAGHLYCRSPWGEVVCVDIKP